MIVSSLLAALLAVTLLGALPLSAAAKPAKLAPPAAATPKRTRAGLSVQPVPTVSFRAAPLITIFAADIKQWLPAGNANCPAAELFKPKPIAVVEAMARYGPRYLCTYSGSYLVLIRESKLNGWYCTALSSKSGCKRKSFWWSVWYKWYSTLSNLGITVDDIRLNRRVTLSATRYARLVRLFWRVFHDHSLPTESTIVHSIHGHSMPKRFLTVPRVSRGGGAFGAPIWHGKEDPCVADTLDILYRYKNIIPRPCKPITYDGSGFYVSSPDLLSSTTLGPDCHHTCGFRYYYGNTQRGQIIAFRTWAGKLANPQSIEGAILDHF